MGPQDTWDTSQQGAPSITIPFSRPASPANPGCQATVLPFSSLFTDGHSAQLGLGGGGGGRGVCLL